MLDSPARADDRFRQLVELSPDAIFIGRDGLIEYLTAAAILNRYVHSHPDHGTDVAEAYYMLGITESLLGRTFWLSKEEFDFESAIRLAPVAPFAQKAYNLLEESYTFGFSGSSGTHIPDDASKLNAVQSHATIVRDLLDFHRRSTKPQWWAVFDHQAKRLDRKSTRLNSSHT